MEKSEYLFPFEKLDIWKLSIDMAETLYKITIDFPSEEQQNECMAKIGVKCE